MMTGLGFVAITNVQSSRKFSVGLTIPFEQHITVSREKLADFLDWLAQ